MIETKLYTLLSGSTVITATVGTKIYPVIAPPKVTHPYIVYRRVSGGQVNGLDGYLTLENPLIQIDVYSTSYSQVKTIAGDLHTVMDGATAFSAVLNTDTDLYEPELELFRQSLDFSIFNRE